MNRFLGGLRWAQVVVLLAAMGPAWPALAAPPARGGRASESAGSAYPAWYRAYAQEKWALASALIESLPESARTPRHWLYLARIRERQMQLVEAAALYERLSDQAPSGLGIQNVGADIRQHATAEAATLSRRLPWAQIVLMGGVPEGAFVFVDDRWLEPARVKSPYPVNPGWHTFLVELNGQVLAAQRLHFEESQQRPVVLRLDQLHPVPPPPAVAPVAHPPAAPSPAPAEPRPPEPKLKLGWNTPERPPPVDYDQNRRLRVASYVSLGLGAVGAGVATGYAVHSWGKRQEMEELVLTCRSGGCADLGTGTQRIDQLQSEANRASSAAVITGIAGSIGLLAGTVLFVLSGDTEPKAVAHLAGIEVDPLLGVDRAGIAGRF